VTRLLGPPDAHLRVLTYKEGVLSAVAHDLELEVTRFVIDVDAESFTVTAEAASLRVLHAMRDGKPAPAVVSARDARKIEQNIASDVLSARRHPQIIFTAKLPADDASECEGRLSLCGREREVRLTLTRDDERLHVRVRLHQPDFGIKPFTAMLGTLRVKADIDVTADVCLSALAPGAGSGSS